MCIHMNPNHYTQICKVSHIYSKGAYNQNRTECNPYLNQTYVNKDASLHPNNSDPLHFSVLDLLQNYTINFQEIYQGYPIYFSLSIPVDGTQSLSFYLVSCYAF